MRVFPDCDCDGALISFFTGPVASAFIFGVRNSIPELLLPPDRRTTSMTGDEHGGNG